MEEYLNINRIVFKRLRRLAAFLARNFFRLQIDGLENVPKVGPFIISPVHRSNVDFFLTSTLSDLQVCFMAKDSLWKNKTLGKFLNKMGTFGVSRGKPDRESLKTSEWVLNQKDVLVVFPEGTRQQGDRVEDIFEGAAFLSIKCQAPIVPVGIAGSELAMPKGSKIIKPVKINIVVGKPISPPKIESGERVKRSMISSFTIDIQRELQNVYDKSREKRKERLGLPD